MRPQSWARHVANGEEEEEDNSSCYTSTVGYQTNLHERLGELSEAGSLDMDAEHSAVGQRQVVPVRMSSVARFCQSAEDTCALLALGIGGWSVVLGLALYAAGTAYVWALLLQPFVVAMCKFGSLLAL